VGDEPLGEFFHVASLLIPLYAPRAWEVMEYGADGASLATAAPVADCFQVAYYCVRNSMLHPRWVATGVTCVSVWAVFLGAFGCVWILQAYASRVA
jgi:cell division protease FtsH